MTGETDTGKLEQSLRAKAVCYPAALQMQQLHDRAGEDLHTLIRRHASHPDTPPSGQRRQVTVHKMNHGYASGRCFRQKT